MNKGKGLLAGKPDQPLAAIHNQPAGGARSERAAGKPALFNDGGNALGERETNAMLEAVAKATTQQRLLEIEKSRHLGLNTDRLTLEQARRIRLAIDARQAGLGAKQSAA